MTKLTHALVLLSALAAFGFASSGALAEQVKDAGSYDSTYVTRDMQPIPDQDGHVLLLTESTGTASHPGGPLDGFSVSTREIADLRQGNGPHEGYVIFSKGSDQQVVRFEGNVTTTMQDGKPNTSMQGSYEIVAASGSLAGNTGAGTYNGRFTAEDKFQVNWDGMRSGSPQTN